MVCLSRIYFIASGTYSVPFVVPQSYLLSEIKFGIFKQFTSISPDYNFAEFLQGEFGCLKNRNIEISAADT